MAEPSRTHTKLLLDLVCREINDESGTQFRFLEMGSDKDSSDDCYIGDDFQRIPVQLTRLEEIPEMFWVDQQINEVMEELIPWGRNAGLRVRVIIRFERVPQGRKKSEALSMISFSS